MTSLGEAHSANVTKSYELCLTLGNQRGAKEIKAQWDERAAGKPKDDPRPVIVSPIQSGSGGFG